MHGQRGGLFKDDYQDLISRLKSLPTSPRVYVVLPPPLYPPFPFNISAHAINIAFQTLQREVANKAHADGIVDVWSAIWGLGGHNVSRGPILDGAPLTCDGCHPNDAGLTMIAQTIATAVRTG